MSQLEGMTQVFSQVFITPTILQVIQVGLTTHLNGHLSTRILLDISAVSPTIFILVFSLFRVIYFYLQTVKKFCNYIIVPH